MMNDLLNFPCDPDPALLAVGGGTVSDTIVRLAALFGLVLLNGFFMACGYAIEKVRGADLPDEPDDEPGPGPRLVRHIASHPEAYLSAARMGVTTTTLLVGVLVWPWVGRALLALAWRMGLPPGWWGSQLAAALIAFVLVLALLVVFGELVPKSIGIRHPESVVRRARWPIDWCRRALHPASRPLEALAALILRGVFRIDPVKEGEVVATTEELQVLVEESEEQDLTDTERKIVVKALELGELKVRDIMVPRSKVVCLDIDHSFELNLARAIESRHTRFPLVRGHLDSTLGLIHIKDLLKLTGQEAADLASIRRELLPVPDQMALDQLLKYFLQEHSHLALVVDEFGGALGLVFLDNVIEQLVGEIHDEFDEGEEGWLRVGADEFTVDGSINLFELAERGGVALEGNGVSTLSGFIIQKLGHVPQEGEAVAIGGYHATITRTDGRRILQVHCRKLPEQEGESADGE